MGMADAKRIQRLYEQVLKTRKNCAYEDLERLLRALGYTVRKTSGSHRIFTKPGSHPISVPERKPVKENYVEMVLAILQDTC
jgi:predicted RNA binding protein YcfA (HicA-like mRNA interferase family)